MNQIEVMKRFTGLKRNPVYVNGDKGGSALADRIQDALEDLGDTIPKMSSAQLDHLVRVLASGLAHVKSAAIERYYKVAAWDRGGPGIDKHGGYDQCWIDHPSKLLDKNPGTTIYRSEPYELDGDGIRELVVLMDKGWDVTIDGHMSAHFPGETVAVLVTKRRASENVLQQQD